MPKVKTPVQKPKVAQVEQSSTSVDPPEKDAENARPPAPKSITFRSRHSSSMSDHFKKRKTMSMKAGLLLPVSKMLKALKKGKYAPIIQRGEVKICFTQSGLLITPYKQVPPYTSPLS